ncbi:helix-turn-helix domain-containing protein [Saccharothrix luteola]|uniref:helix-turn-helix domain-containing protein n=1 Tax=Saccharothrix luteola TaxID=2893018 RepID=UPI001E58E6E3|nr:helix-turn-helix transcriptional regulator [Saccharothrix luteola]MCC8250539.1 helix-turn-helix transcriptional regulator [Saccharothrix luteola]
MNVTGGDRPIDPVVWHGREMREALARRDIGRVYQLLRRFGVSQRQIAACTGQNQSEISAITNGRQVQAYDVLERIADGLGVPRGYMGLAYTDEAAHSAAVASGLHRTKDDFMLERRGFLGLISKIVMGAALTQAEVNLLAVGPATTAIPNRVGATDVDQVRALTAALRSYDATHGGGACRDAILAHTHWAQSLLNASATDDVKANLLSAIAEAKTLAGWTAHDLGLKHDARRWLGQAVHDTQEAGDPAHTAIVLYHLGRVPLDNDDPDEALKLFQLGQIAAQDSHSSVAVSLLLTHEALAYAHLGDTRQAMTALRRAEDEYAHATPDQHQEFLRFFDHAALQTSAARVHSRLGLTDAAHRELAVERLQRALDEAPADRMRQRAFNLTWMAACTLAEGDLASGVEFGHQALDAVRVIQSTRLLDNLKPLEDAAGRHTTASDVQQLHHEIQLLRSAA